MLLCVFALLPLGVRAATNDLSSALQTGLFEEEANRNLSAAMEAYEKVAKQFDQNRALAATAIFRLGEVNRKLGKTNEAAVFYQRILREFGDQNTLAKLSQQNLAGMGVNESRTTTVTAPGSLEGLRQLLQQQLEHAEAEAQAEKKRQMKGESDESRVRERLFTVLSIRRMLMELQDAGEAPAELSPEAQELARTQMIIAQLRGWDLSQLRRLIPTLVPDAEFDRLNEQLRLNENFGESGAVKPEILKQRSELMDKLDERSQIIRRQLEVRAEELAKTVAEQEKSKLAVDRALPKTSAITAVLDEEEAEIRRIQAMIQNSPDLINGPGRVEDKLTPLCLAASKGQLRVASFLLDHGADINLNSPLRSATAGGHRAMVELLLQRGSEVNAADSSGKTALHLAAESGFLSVTEVLLAAKADPNVCDVSSQTPLTLAAKRGYRPVVAALLAHEADPNLASNVEPGRGANPVSVGRAMFGAPLHFAAARGDVVLTALLLTNRADVKVRSLYDETPLNVAAVRGHARVVEMLLAAGADPNTEDKSGRTVLSFAAEAGQLEIVKVLLAAKADPNAGKGNLPLHCAIKNQSAGIVEALLKAGADANRTSSLTWRRPSSNSDVTYGKEVTPLAVAVDDGQFDLIKLLLTHKADPNGKNKDGFPLIFSAVNDAELMKAFLDASANPNVDDGTVHRRTPLTMSSQPKVVSLLLAAGVNPETRHRHICDSSEVGLTPLLVQAACGANPIPIAEALLKGGANVNARTATGATALHQAAANKNKELMELLIAYKADVNARDNQGLTPLDYAEGKHQPTGAPGLPTVVSIPTPGRPIRGTGQAEVNSEPVADLLRQHGGLGDLPKLDRIEVTRPETGYREAVFVSGTNQWNQFTLVELLAKQWGLLSLQRKGTWSGDHAERSIFRNGSPLRFPALDRITIHRTSQSGARREKIAVNFDEAISKQGRAGDVPLQYGDVVEIPEEDHAVTELWLGLPNKSLAVMTNRLARSVSLKVGGLSTNLSLHPSLDPSPTLGALKLTAASFMLRSVLDESKLIRSSSDLTRVRVTRRESANAKPRVWILDCSVPDKAPDLWLRDGDVIEVPEK